MDRLSEASLENEYYTDHVELMISSFANLTRRKLLEGDYASALDRARALYEAPFAVVSHGTEDIPIFNYGNLAGQKAFEMSWTEFCHLESHKSAEGITQEERDALLARVTADGFIDDYRGVRISSTGQRFMIEDAVVWNLVDEDGVYRGQAAVLYKWSSLRSQP